MPKATTANLDGRVVGIDEGIELRDAADRRRVPKPQFTCRECGGRVRPHREGTTGQGAHYEHVPANPSCSLSGKSVRRRS